MNLLLQWYLGDAAVVFAARIIVEITLLIAIAGLLASISLRRRPAARHALWLGVLISVVLAPLTVAAVEQAGWMWTVRRPLILGRVPLIANPAPVPALRKGTPAQTQRPFADSANGAAREVADALGMSTPSPEAAHIAAESLPWSAAEVGRSLASAGFISWLAGAAFLLARLLRGNRQVRRLLRDVQPVKPGVIDESVAIAAGTLGVKSLPRIATSPTVVGPVVAGLVRPTVVLPTGFVRTAEAAQVADVLIHECAHALRRDPWIGLGQRLVQMAFWPHPLVHYLNRSLTRAREEICDNYVLRRGDAPSYAQTLLELARRYDARPVPAEILAIFSPRWKLEHRVAGLLDPRREQGTCFGPARFLVLLAILVVAGSALASGRFDETVPIAEAPTREPEKTIATVPPPLAASEKALQALDKPTTVEFLDLPLTDALKYLAEKNSIAIRIDQDSLNAAEIVPAKMRVVLRLTGYSLRTVLSLLLEPESLGFFVDGDELVVTTRQKADAHIEETAYDLGDAVRGGVSLADVGDAIIQLLDRATWKQHGGDGQLRIEETKLVVRQRADVQRHLERLLGDLDRAIIAVPGLFEDAQLELKAYPIGDLQKGISDTDLGAWLREWLLVATVPQDLGRADLKIEAGKLLLKQAPWVHAVVAKRLADVRERGKRESGRPRTREDFTFAKGGLLAEAQRQTIRKQLANRYSAEFVDLPAEDALTFLKEISRNNVWFGRVEAKKRGINLDKPVTFKAANEPLADLFDMTLMGMPMDWYVLEPGLIIVAPPEEGAAALEPRVYGIQELRESGQTVEGLLLLVTNLDPDSWSTAGGPGSMRPLSPGMLIVNHTRRMHKQIDKLFEKLAPAPKGSR